MIVFKNIKKYWQFFRSPDKYPSISWIVSLFWLGGISAIAFLGNLGSTGLVDETEPLFAEAARQMTVTGNWITPYFNEVTRFDKPPLIYWLMALGYKLIGVNEWAVRLPSALSAIALMLLGFYTLKRFGVSDQNSHETEQQSWFTAWLGAALMSLNLHTIIWGRTGVSDMLLSSCMGMSLLCFFVGYTVSNNSEFSLKKKLEIPNKWYLACYILISLAVLSKGPVGIVLPSIIITCFLLYVGQFTLVIQEMNLLIGIVIFIIITVPWYVLVFLENGQAYIDSFFGYHNFERFTHVVNGHSADWYFYLIIILGLFAPWSVYLPVSIHNLSWWRVNWWRRQKRSNHLLIFVFIWLITVFIFFSISVTKLPSYILPLVPAAAILVAISWNKYLVKSPRNKGWLISIIANLVLAIVLAVAFYFSPHLIGEDPAIFQVDMLLKQSLFPQLGVIIWGTIGIAIAFCLIKIQYRHWIILINLMGFIFFTAFLIIPLNSFIDLHRQLPLREIAQEIVTVHKENEPIIMLGFKKPSLVFYSQKSIKFLNRPETLIEYLTNSQSDTNSHSILIISREKELRKIPNLSPTNYEQIAEKGVYQLIRANLSVQ